MFQGGGKNFPVLKGKAAEIRGVLPAVTFVFTHHMDRTNTQHKQVKLALEAACEMEALLDDHKDSYTLPPGAADTFAKAANSLVLLQTALGNYFHARGILLFNFTIKSHYLLHLGMLCSHINPRAAWCYSGEDLMAKVKGIVQASTRGANATRIPAKVMEKYVRALGLGMHEDVWR